MKILEILNMIDHETGIASSMNRNRDSSDEYITYNMTTRNPIVSADNISIFYSYNFQVHLFVKGNRSYTEQYNKIESFLEKNQITIADSVFLYEDDTKINHIVFECVYSEGRES